MNLRGAPFLLLALVGLLYVQHTNAQDNGKKELSYSLESVNLKVNLVQRDQADAAYAEFFEIAIEQKVTPITIGSGYEGLTGERLEKKLIGNYPKLFKRDSGKYVNGLKEIHLSNESVHTTQYLDFLKVNKCNWVEIRRTSKSQYHEGGYGRHAATTFINLDSGVQFEVEGFGQMLAGCDVAYGDNGNSFTWLDVGSKGYIKINFDEPWTIKRFSTSSNLILMELRGPGEKLKYMEIRTTKP